MSSQQSEASMAPFPSLPMAALTMGLFSAWFVQLSMSAYVGYMVDNLGIVNDKDQAGEASFSDH